MKFRGRMILAYTIIAFIASLALGVTLSRTGLQYEENIQESNLILAGQSYVSQVDETLDRMDAIMQYMLADPTILDGMTTLSQMRGEELNSLYGREAAYAIQLGMATTYIMENSYRTVFFNENSYFSSAVKIVISPGEQIPLQKMRSAFSLEDISYLSKADDANGKIVIVPEHDDYWQIDGDDKVFSLVKKIRGEKMGYLEVENRMSLLEELESSDPNQKYVIYLESGEILFASEQAESEEIINLQNRLWSTEAGNVQQEKEFLLTRISSEKYGYSIGVYLSNAEYLHKKANIFATAFGAALLVFMICLAFIIYLSNYLTKPIVELKKVMENTSLDNLKERQELRAGEGPDEFQEFMNAYQKMTGRLDTALRNEKRASILQLQAQFDMLQTQINPHFLYNVLNIISSRAIIADDEVICEMCGCLGNMLRYSTNNKERYAALEDEAVYLENYFYLLKARYENRLEIRLEIPEEVKRIIVPKMTLQPLVENAIKHGFHDTDIHMCIEILAAKAEDRWTITVQDNGSGVSEERLAEIREHLDQIRSKMLIQKEVPTEAEIGGLGLVNTYARGLLLYQEDLVFEMRNRTHQQGFSVTLGAKIRKNEGDKKE